MILIVEDEPIIALDLQGILEDHGAQTITAYSLAEALVAVESPSISAAVLDHALGDGDCSELCRRLAARSVPFITSSGTPNLTGPCAGAINVTKPVKPSVLVTALSTLYVK